MSTQIKRSIYLLSIFLFTFSSASAAETSLPEDLKNKRFYSVDIFDGMYAQPEGGGKIVIRTYEDRVRLYTVRYTYNLTKSEAISDGVRSGYNLYFSDDLGEKYYKVEVIDSEMGIYKWTYGDSNDPDYSFLAVDEAKQAKLFDRKARSVSWAGAKEAVKLAIELANGKLARENVTARDILPRLGQMRFYAVERLGGTYWLDRDYEANSFRFNEKVVAIKGEARDVSSFNLTDKGMAFSLQSSTAGTRAETVTIEEAYNSGAEVYNLTISPASGGAPTKYILVDAAGLAIDDNSYRTNKPWVNVMSPVFYTSLRSLMKDNADSKVRLRKATRMDNRVAYIEKKYPKGKIIDKLKLDYNGDGYQDEVIVTKELLDGYGGVIFNMNIFEGLNRAGSSSLVASVAFYTNYFEDVDIMISMINNDVKVILSNEDDEVKYAEKKSYLWRYSPSIQDWNFVEATSNKTLLSSDQNIKPLKHLDEVNIFDTSKLERNLFGK